MSYKELNDTIKKLDSLSNNFDFTDKSQKWYGSTIFGLKMDFDRDRAGWFFYFAKAEMRGPAYADLRNLSGTWE